GSRPKPLPIFSRSNERLNHLSSNEVAVELIQLVQPKLIACVVRVLWIVRVAAQVTEELHQHERAVELLARQSRVLSHVTQRTPPRCRVAGVGRGTEFIDGCLPFAG